MKFSNISAECKLLVDRLNWQTYHTPENLTAILVGEVGELSELCVWLSREQIQKNKTIKKQVAEELADVVKAVIFLYNSLHLEIALETLIATKLKIEGKKYPVNVYKGKSKYENITPEERKRMKQVDLPTKNIHPTPSIDSLEEQAWTNSTDRAWDKYYSPASLCLGIFEDCSKIYTSFQRRTNTIKNGYQKLVWAIAGILILSLRLHRYLGFKDLGRSVLRKANKDYERFNNWSR